MKISRDDVLELMAQARLSTADDDTLLADYDADCDAPPFAAEPDGKTVEMRALCSTQANGDCYVFGYRRHGEIAGLDETIEGVDHESGSRLSWITFDAPLPVVVEVVGTVESVDDV